MSTPVTLPGGEGHEAGSAREVEDVLAALEGGVLDECGGVGGVPGGVVGGGAGAVEELGLVGLGGEWVHFARRWRGGRGGFRDGKGCGNGRKAKCAPPVDIAQAYIQKPPGCIGNFIADTHPVNQWSNTRWIVLNRLSKRATGYTSRMTSPAPITNVASGDTRDLGGTGYSYGQRTLRVSLFEP